MKPLPLSPVSHEAESLGVPSTPQNTTKENRGCRGWVAGSERTEELGPHQGPTEGTGDWSSEEPEEEQEETGAGPAGYSYQPLNQDPEQEEVELAPVGDGEDVVADIQDRIQALGLHLPDPPLESEDEDEQGATALNNHSSIPMDPEHVELVKRTMAGISLPAPGVPAWAREISDAQWEDVVQKALQARQAAPAWK